MTRRPHSLTATIALTVVVTLAIGLTFQPVIGTSMRYLGFDQQQPLPRAEERILQIPGKVATLSDILDRTPVADRPNILAAAQIPGIRLQLLDAPAPNVGDRGEPDAELLRQRIETALTAPRPIIVMNSYRPVDPKAGPAAGRIENGAWIEVALANGQWLLLAANRDPPRPSDPGTTKSSLTRIAAWLVLSLAVVAVLPVFAARHVIRPLSELSVAVDRLGGSGDDPPLQPRGPREIEGITAAFNRLRRRMRRFNEDRTQMMAAMSHDLRTPLTRLRVRIEMAQGLEDQQKMLEEIDRMDGMVESVLSFARDDVKQEPRSLVDLSSLVEGICEDAVDAGEKVTFSGPRDVITSCRPNALRRAISNLVDNAVKYGGKASVGLTPDDGRILIKVDDEGPGIPRSEREKVFEPFYRIGSARDPRTGGVGLGLSVTRSIIWEHGGDISLGSRKSGGLSVRLELPVESSTSHAEAAP